MSAGVYSLIIAVDGSALGLAFLGLLSGHGHSQFGYTKVYTNSYDWESTLIKTYPRLPLLFFTLPVFCRQPNTTQITGKEDRIVTTPTGLDLLF